MNTDNNDVETMYLYTEKATRRIFEAKLFEDFVLARPVDPEYYSHIRKVTYNVFANEFEEYSGNFDQIRDALRGGAAVTVLN